MADEFCYSLLQATTLQLLQAAGFDSGNTSSIRTLTHIFEKYLELLSSSATAFSQHHGRTSSSIYDLLEAFDELGVDVPSLVDWIGEEKRALIPLWTEQADPSRTLKDTVYKGLERQESIVYDYCDLPDVTTAPSNDERDLNKVEHEEEDITDTQAPADKSLPDYIPTHFPPFPIISLNEDEEITQLQQPSQDIKPLAAILKPALGPKQSASIVTANEPKDFLPMPNIVKRKARPIENPFTYLKPFEDSMLATMTASTTFSNTSTSLSDVKKDQVEPLSMLLVSNLRKAEENPTEKTPHPHESNSTDSFQPFGGRASRKRRNTSELLQLLKKIKYEDEADQNDNDSTISSNKDKSEVKKPLRPPLEGISLFEEEIRNGAAPGNALFQKENKGLLETLITCIAPPIAVPKLLTPNLMVDMYHTPSSGSNTPSTSGRTLRLNMSKLKDAAAEPTAKGSAAVGGRGRKSSLGGFTIDESTKEPNEDELSDMNVPSDSGTVKDKRRSSSSKNRRGSNSNPATSKGLPTSKRSKTTPISLAALAAGAGSSAQNVATSDTNNPKRKLTIHLPKLGNSTSTTTTNSSHKASLNSATDLAPTTPLTSPTGNGTTAASLATDTTTTATNTNTVPKIRFKIKLPTPDSEQSKP